MFYGNRYRISEFSHNKTNPKQERGRTPTKTIGWGTTPTTPEG
jgi:hypothetical protein